VTRALLLLALALRGVASGGGSPDLRLDLPSLGTGISYDLLFFPTDACELQASDLCVREPGARKLLRFNVFAVNQGDADLVLGVATPENPAFIFSQCHQHFHFDTFARYELRPRGGGEPILGQKRSFCVEDTRADTATGGRRYCCRTSDVCEQPGIQGIQVGWGDLYASNLPCQWIDVTDDVPAGDYDLCVLLNTAGLLPDRDPDNDTGCVPVTVDAPDPAAAPRVKVRAPKARPKRREGKALKIAWQRHARGEVRYQEVWFSRNDGTTWTLVGGGPNEIPTRRKTFRWTIPAGSATDAGRIRVVVWTRVAGATGAAAFARGAGESKPFVIVP
jgi:hypothetical protein